MVFKTVLSVTALATTLIALSTSTYAIVREELSDDTLKGVTITLTFSPEDGQESTDVRSTSTGSSAAINHLPLLQEFSTIIESVSGQVAPEFYEEQLQKPAVQALLNTPAVNDLLALFGTSTARIGEKAANHTRRETERQENFQAFGRYATNREIVKLRAQGKL